ncbi:MAG: NADH:ubiquinone reductase (Na(+)-transporting) subunit B [Bacteroidetes bacterium]|nr:MAG: NADH:ubiquinone reductase (Na(+)-transporting) subunit B [Bacteroidota bacterium]
MKALRKYLDKIKPNVEKGGRFHYMLSTFEAFETFLFVPNTVTKKGSHIRDAIDLKRTMFMVVIALVPAFLFGTWNVGYQHNLSMGVDADILTNFMYGIWWVLPLVIVSYVVGLGTEFVFAQMRGHEVNEGYLVSGFLIPLIVPVTTPLWMVALATIFAVIIGKEVFGGTGMNFMNPALLARAFLFFAYPSQMSGDKVWISEKADAFSGATPLGHLMTATDSVDLPSVSDAFFGFLPGSVGETSTLAILIGAIILLWTGIASWRVMFSVFIGGFAMGFLFNQVGANVYMNDVPAYYHLILGGFAFGAVFMATDPVTAAQTNKGKYIYGFLIGVMAVLIRVLNPAYPEGMMLSILLLNVFAPLIDHYVVQGNIKRRNKRAKKVAA